MGSITRTLATIVLFFTLASVSSACRGDEKEVLLALKASFPHNSFPLSWNTSADCCTWQSIQCEAGRVYILQISNDAGKTIPTSGPIPPSIGRLSSLRMLFLEDLNMTGPIPPSLSNLTTLDTLYLKGNRLTGPIPDSLFSVATSRAIRLDLSNNQLTGRIPPSFGRVGFTFVEASNNMLTGDASFLFGKHKKVVNIILAGNRLAFDLTKVVYPEYKFFQYLDLSRNEIYGSISAQINRAKNLEHFNVSYNRLCGKIPSGVVLDQFDSSAFAHNKCLCGAPLSPCK